MEICWQDHYCWCSSLLHHLTENTNVDSLSIINWHSFLLQICNHVYTHKAISVLHIASLVFKKEHKPLYNLDYELINHLLNESLMAFQIWNGWLDHTSLWQLSICSKQCYHSYNSPVRPPFTSSILLLNLFWKHENMLAFSIISFNQK